jgi:hypothetical protein
MMYDYANDFTDHFFYPQVKKNIRPVGAYAFLLEISTVANN